MFIAKRDVVSIHDKFLLLLANDVGLHGEMMCRLNS